MTRAATNFDRWWWLAALACAPLLALAGAPFERVALALALVAAIVAIAPSPWRRVLTAVVAAFVAACVGSLVIHLLADDFGYRYVWLYSATTLPWYLKVANLWGGDEGALLCLAVLMTMVARRMIRFAGWAGPGALLIAVVLIGGTLVWSPFNTLRADTGTSAEGLGMNAHLLSVWMAFHPPLVLIAYALVLAPVGAALEALALDTGDWFRIARRDLRVAWFVLSLGIGLGMWWAYEDFSFGQIWHWDPVQTSLFIVWAFLTATVHGLTLSGPKGRFARTLPFLSLLSGVAVCVALTVTRTTTVASSHRFIGASSVWLYVALAGVIALLASGAFVMAIRRGGQRRPPLREHVWFIAFAISAFVLCACVAAWFLGQAYAGALLGLPRPATLKPFFEMLARWADPAELAQLRGVFAQWDVSVFGANQALAVVGIAIGLVGGHAFLPGRGRWRWLVSGMVAVSAVLGATVLTPFDLLYEGAGMTSKNTVAMFWALDALLVAVGYLVLAAVVWVVYGVVRAGNRARALRRRYPVAAIHAGVAMALGAALVATVLDSYAQKIVSYPDDFGRALAFPGGYSVTVTLERAGTVADGGRSDTGADGLRAVTDVGWSLTRDGRVMERASGHTVYRDAPPPALRDPGPIRLMCEMIDYRYARYVSDGHQVIHPFIHRGLWRDVQVWVAIPVAADIGGAMSGGGRPPWKVPIVVKIYPMMSWVWIGLAVALSGMLALLLPGIVSVPTSRAFRKPVGRTGDRRERGLGCRGNETGRERV